MRVGTRSLLFGVHQVILHPVFVLIAWIRLYGFPGWRELVCIAIHDWGYWSTPNMDGPEGEDHPRRGAIIADRLFGQPYGELCLYHSRHYTRLANACLQGLGEDPIEPSRLCWADKLSHIYYPTWLYLALARLSGELREYRAVADRAGAFPAGQSDREWFAWIQQRFRKMALEGDHDMTYVNPLRRRSVAS